MKEEIKNSVLRSVANTLSMYVYHIDGNGLVNGKMGIMLFLYAYSRYANRVCYNDFADEMLDGMLKVSRSLPPDFENGLSGVGWGVNWLMKHDFVDGDVNKVLKPVDDRLLAGLSGETLSVLNYWPDRLCQSVPECHAAECVAGLLSFVSDSLKKNGGRLSLYYVNAVLYFLHRVERWLKPEEESEVIRALLPIINNVFCKLAFDGADLFIFHRLLRRLNGKVVLSKEIEMAFCMYASVPLTLGQRIKAAWQEWIYFDKVTCPLPKDDEVTDYVDKTLQGVQLNDFTLNQGLAGLGLWILNL